MDRLALPSGSVRPEEEGACCPQTWHYGHMRACRYILSIRLKQPGEAEESALQQWVEQAAPGAELQQKTPGNLSFSIAQEVCLICSSV